MEAKEMFEALGYKCYENHPKEEIKPNTFTTQDTPYIEYKQEDETSIETIRFDLSSKNVWFIGFRKDLQRQLPCPVNMKELEAICMQVVQLGWLDEE